MDLYAKAQSLGIQTEYIDGSGHRRVTTPEALTAILAALPPHTPRRIVIDPVVVRGGHGGQTQLSEAARLPVQWKLSSGSAVLAQGEARERSVTWPAGLPEGVHRLQLKDASGSEELPLLVAPDRAFGGAFDRCWVIAVQLYGVRSARNWGIGDFTDLEGLLAFAHRLGADGIGLNPLHALFDDRPGDCSPYSPNSRLFLNALYIDVEKIPEYRVDAATQAALAQLRSRDMVDYVGVAALKWPALRAAFAAFKANPGLGRWQDFEAYRKEQGTLLSRFACFEVVRHKFNTPWWEWPDDWRQPDDAACTKLRWARDTAAEVEFVEFVQWTADRQLGACQGLAHKLGMRVGLYLDVAVGVQSDGFDAWNEQTAISRHLGVGAPPDPLNTAGQDWGLAGFNAAGLEQRSFEPFRQMLRASMHHAGAIRLDHAFGLKRLYLVPRGFGPANGAYVLMPFEALLAATAQESAASRCVVIGEDLGTVPPGFREQMNGWGIWSYLVMMFETDDQGVFRNADYYLPDALVTFNTHDLSTYAGWRSFSDLKTKRALGIDPGETDQGRWDALGRLDDVLRRLDIHHNDFYSVVGFMARTRSRILAVSMEDLLGIVEQPNIPGTVYEHPNWKQRLPVSIEHLASAIDIDALKRATRERSHA
ncbi:4-alpha-glucanotransferase [Bradyrhizobium viridifuturi]|jgi:4-alpha-glucanotransferase|uniref:4-alpha-glucanotransferase n=2 Tax=Pseudomonadota TaxID=1224 RepID=UPI0003980C03|nr:MULTISPECIES: 4-alpha-glucanotransferase [Bradyrhizobium]ERF80458.1 MAG: 4-alpha-glucanotransferase [Bradyrhizobium sp. DFCI-1]PSO16744.1 4-alpha-glucanotransferase [Bradyrhizobium sp. MOS004]QRI68252.1 4-alpha-glucanotransferase [Bradyrhizobium sp. PSBB068]MBR1024877.1 4-alpha-glucanotransferase [Bradyrhizobium viridifuturi]MBR1041685.1 4-alpha-glucanotransferase [Bradyrhizobium viridifuturi]